jgi:ABC-2 type transport system permease protein
MFIRLLAVLKRDLLKFKRNPVVIAMSLVMPIVYLIILGNSFQGKLKDLPIAIINQDGGIESRRFIERLQAIQDGPQTFTLIFMNDPDLATREIREGRLKAAIVIPPHFTKRVLAKARAEVGLVVDNTDTISAPTISSTVQGAFNAIPIRYYPVRENPAQDYLREIDLYRKIDYDQFLVPGVVIMAIFLGTLTTGAFNLVMDRFLGVDESYLLTPLTKADIVGGLIISGVFITTIISLLVFTMSLLITSTPLASLGQLLMLVVIIVLTVLALLSMMFIFMGRVNHPRIVGLLSGFMNVIFFFPSGAVYPVESFPKWLKAFSKINPEAYAVHAFKSVLFKNAGIGAIYFDLIFLIIFTAIMMTTGILAFKRTL